MQETGDNLFSNEENLSYDEFFSTHPTNEERVLNLEKMIPELLKARKNFGCEELSSSFIAYVHLLRKVKTIMRFG